VIPEAWIDRFAIAGTPDEVRSRLEQAIKQGAQEISLILMGTRTADRGGSEQLTRFAESVMQPMQRSLQASVQGVG
jgi:alkanesulfonate monooxygenase SsuD/methylene tetrahydromethanopterin reductase-like flavin-dependent oxidoreductase (luciferase family)